MRKISILTMILLVFVSCINREQKNEKDEVFQTDAKKEKLLQIDPRKFGDNELNLADFAADVEYIPLSNKIRMGFIRGLKVTSKAIYLVSDESSGGEGNGHQELFRFDKNGNNPVQIGKIGKGPQEYLSCTNFAVDEQNDRIYINGKLKTVLVFNTRGEYLRQFKFQNPEQRFSVLEIFNNGNLFMGEKVRGANGSFLWFVTDTLGNIISQKNNFTPSFETQMGAHGGISKFKNTILYWAGYNDTLFEIAPDFSYHASYIITPGEHRVTHQNLPFSLDLPERLLEFYSPHFFWETNKFLISRYNFKGKFAYVFIDKNTRRTFVCRYEWKRDTQGGISNNFDGGLMFSPEAYYESNGDEFLVGYVLPYQLKIHVASDEFKNSTPLFPEKKKELEQLANSLDENDNPVLMLVKLKE